MWRVNSYRSSSYPFTSMGRRYGQFFDIPSSFPEWSETCPNGVQDSNFVVIFLRGQQLTLLSRTMNVVQFIAYWEVFTKLTVSCPARKHLAAEHALEKGENQSKSNILRRIAALDRKRLIFTLDSIRPQTVRNVAKGLVTSNNRLSVRSFWPFFCFYFSVGSRRNDLDLSTGGTETNQSNGFLSNFGVRQIVWTSMTSSFEWITLDISGPHSQEVGNFLSFCLK